MSSDYLTLIRSNQRANKLVRNKDGQLLKKPGIPIKEATAQTVHVPNVHTMARLLKRVASDSHLVLAQGFFPGTEPSAGKRLGKPFRIASEQWLSRQLGRPYEGGWEEIEGERYIARLKKNMEPSSWLQLDRDYAEGMPLELEALDDEQWLRRISLLIPGFEQAGWVRIASTSSRVLLEGQSITEIGCRYWFQIDNPADETFGSRLLLQAAAKGLGFQKLNKKGSKTLWSIFDPTVFSHERLSFDGKPTLIGEGLSIADPSIVINEGPRVIAKMVSDVTPKEEDQIRRRYGVGTRRSGGVGVLESLKDTTQLQLETEIETQHHGIMTVQQFMDSDHKHVRCQAAFRESNSWNGFLARDDEGMPRLYDNGTRCWYELNPELKRQIRMERVRSLAESGNLERILADESVSLFAVMRRHHPTDWALVRPSLKKIDGLSITILESAMDQVQPTGNDITPIDIAHAAIRAVGEGNIIFRHGSFWYWDEERPGAWRRLSDDGWLKKKIHETLKRVLGKKWASRTVADTLSLMGPECFTPGQMDLPGGGINVLNGELHQTDDGFDLRPHRKHMLSTVCLPVKYDPEAQCPRFQKFLYQIFDDGQLTEVQIKRRIKLVQQIMGYTLLRDCRAEKMIFLIGEGSNGKSVLLFVIQSLLGPENVCAVQPKQYNNRFQRAHFEGRLANIVTEIGKGDLLPDDEVKALVTGERMTVEDKGKDPREISPFATLWHATNHMPRLRDNSYAMRRRAEILRLRRNFDEEPELKDINLKSSIVESELPGVLNFALEGLESVFTEGWIKVQESREEVEHWVRGGDTVFQWIEDECVRDPDAWMPTVHLREAYVEWCQANGMIQLGGKEFTNSLKREGFKARRNGNPAARGWAGIHLTDRAFDALDYATDITDGVSLLSTRK